MSSYTNPYAYMPSVTDVIGYTWNGEAYCPPCATNDSRFDTEDMDAVGAIFGGAEMDYVPACDICHAPIDGVTVLHNDGPDCQCADCLSDIFDCADCGNPVMPYHVNGCECCGSLYPLNGTPTVEHWTCNLCGTSDHESESDAESCCATNSHCPYCDDYDCECSHHDPDTEDAHDMECQCGDCLTNRTDPN